VKAVHLKAKAAFGSVCVCPAHHTINTEEADDIPTSEFLKGRKEKYLSIFLSCESEKVGNISGTFRRTIHIHAVYHKIDDDCVCVPHRIVFFIPRRMVEEKK